PLFGSRGVGVTRIRDREVAYRVCRTLAYFHHVLYLQQFIPHGRSDVRAFVVGDEVVAAMRRSATGWKTNVAQGARPQPYTVSKEERRLALEAARALGCAVAGVDVMKTREGEFYVNEVNSQPDWRGLQSVATVSIAEKIARHVVRSVKGVSS
ncbi:MAG: 30S ribosomal protein S6--L-glutamate ligase, partial [Candidatus Bathyarchaeia archaeon]